MEVKVTWKYTLELTKDEWLLVSKGLRGTLKPGEMEAATELQRKMLQEKHKMLNQALVESQKAIDNSERAAAEQG